MMNFFDYIFLKFVQVFFFYLICKVTIKKVKYVSAECDHDNKLVYISCIVFSMKFTLVNLTIEPSATVRII